MPFFDFLQFVIISASYYFWHMVLDLAFYMPRSGALPNKGYWILGISPKKSITVGLKAKARRNELEDRFRLLNWQTLEKRRDFLSLVQGYKFVFGIDSLPFSDFFELTKFNRTRANRDYKLYVKVAILKAPNILSLYGSLVRGITCLKIVYTQDRWLYFATD